MARALGTTWELILDAARSGLLTDGYAGLSTRKVAVGADVPLSQLHYHFGGNQQLILSVLARETERLLERQARMYGEDRPLWERYELACDFLDEDLASGYVRVLQEMTAAGWANDEIAVQVRAIVQTWVDLLAGVVGEAEKQGLPLGPFLYFPLANHFEQQRHLAYRLDRYRAGRRLQLAQVGPEDIADALLAELGWEPDYLPVETDGAARAARLLAELL